MATDPAMPHPQIDPTAFLAPGALVMGDVVLGPESSVWYGAVLRGDTEAIRIGPQSNIQDQTLVHADPGTPCVIGARVTVGHRVILHGCTVEDDCLIGMGAILLNGCHNGRGSGIAAGTLIGEGKSIAPGSLIMGVPGRLLRPVDAPLLARIAHAWPHYIAMAQRHRNGEFPPAPETSAAGI